MKLGVSARLKELSGKKDPICIFIDNWFVCVERAGGSGGKGGGRKWWSETARAAIPCLMSWREIVSNWGRSQRGSLSDWPFTVPCHIWPGNINMRPALQHASVSVCGKQRAHASEQACACTRVRADVLWHTTRPVLRVKIPPFRSQGAALRAFVGKPVPDAAGETVLALTTLHSRDRTGTGR